MISWNGKLPDKVTVLNEPTKGEHVEMNDSIPF